MNLIQQANDLPLVQELSPRDKLLYIEDIVHTLPNILDTIPINHHFSEGLYAREGFIAKGTMLVGRIHKHGQINVLVSGDISIMTEKGVKRFDTPQVIVSEPGVKRIGYAHEDTIFITILATNLKDPEIIEDTYTTLSYEEFDNFMLQGGSLCSEP